MTFVFKSNTEIVEPTIVDTKKENIIETQDFQNLDTLEENNAVAIEESENKTKKAIKHAPNITGRSLRVVNQGNWWISDNLVGTRNISKKTLGAFPS